MLEPFGLGHEHATAERRHTIKPPRHVIVSLGQAADAGLEELLDRAAKGWNR